MKLGAQFYTIRDFCKNLNDFSESIKKIADIGYKQVQISGTCDFEPEWLNEQLNANGLKCVLTHTPPQKLINDPAKAARDHDIFGCENVGIGWFGFDEEKEGQKFDDFIRIYTPVIKSLKNNGKYFMFHNHDREFIPYKNKLIIENLAEAFSPEEMGFTLDTYWVQVAGGDPAQWIEKLAGRVPCIHLKDCAYAQKIAVIGEGNINFDRVFEKAESSGTEYLLVELDDCYGEDPFECLKRSYKNLKALGFE